MRASTTTSATTATRAQGRPLTRRLGEAFFGVLAWAPALIIFFPLGLLLRMSVSVTADSRGISGLALDAFTRAWTAVGSAAVFSMKIASLSAVTTVALAMPIAYVICARPGKVARMLSLLISLPIIIPAFLIGMGLILAYPSLHGSFHIIYCAYVTLALPFAVWPLVTAMQMVDIDTLERASRTLGAKGHHRILMVFLPVLKRPAVIAAGSVYAAFLAESSASFFLASADYQPLGIALYNSFQDVDTRVSAAAVIIYVAMLAVPLLLAELWLKTSSNQLPGSAGAGH